MLLRLLQYYSEILRWERLGVEATRARQVAKFRSAFEHARAHSRFYREIYGDAGVLDLEVRDMDDVRRIPIVDKSMLRAAPLEDRMTVPPSTSGLVTQVTSGSTGEPFGVYFTRPDLYTAHVRVFRCLQRQGYTPRRSITLIHKYEEDVELTIERDVGMLDALQRRLGLFRRRFVSIYLPVDELIEVIREEAPDILWTTPSVMLMVAYRLRDLGERLDVPVMLAMSETLFPPQVALLEERVARRVVGHYGMMEAPTVAIDAREGARRDVFAESFLAECVDLPGAPDIDGGTLVLTNFVNRTMPFIRYSTGDLIERIDDPGFPSRVLGPILGRTDDVLVLGDGSTLAYHHGFEMFSDLEAVEQWKIIRTPDALQLHLKPTAAHRGRAEELTERVLTAWRNRYGAEPIDVVITDAFAIDPSTGKTKAIEDRR